MTLLELSPTILDLADVAAPALAGRLGLADAIRGEAEPPRAPFVVEDGGAFRFAVRHGDDVLVHGRPFGLFDLSVDPLETRDLSETRPARVRELEDVAVAHFLENRPGRYLLMSAATPLRDVHVEVSPSASLRVWLSPSFLDDVTRVPRVEPGQRVLYRLRCGSDPVVVTWVDEAGHHREPVRFGPFDRGSASIGDGATVVGVQTRCGEVRPEAATRAIDPETLEQLRAQGYVQ